MKPRTIDFLTHKFNFQSREETKSFLWFCEHDIEVQRPCPAVVGYGDSIWTPDFGLPDFNVKAECKPIPFWDETLRIKPIVYAGIQNGLRFYTWFIVWEHKRPRIYECTRFDPESKDPEEVQMQRFYICDPPIEIPIANKDPQLLLL